ncbi:alpha/beta hydrolase family protein [Sphingopyxis kveilinensis]|uniref:alpha/beta hydrolase family protein n=1 Tax=Sphingopyxis kveilinensis TaxID=3114367 RepID=UPI0030D21B71
MKYCGTILLALSGAMLSATSAVAETAPPPWSAAPTTKVTADGFIVENAGASLAATLHLPAANQPVAAVIVTHGASSPLRSSPLYDHLIQMLPAMGIAVLTYDRRGSGESTGQAGTGDYALLADDAIAGARALMKDPRIDPRRIGIWGLSQGGWLALLAASRSPDLAFAISVSAPMVTPDVQMIFSSENSLRVNGYSQADIDQMVATRKAVDDYMRGTADRATAQKMVDAAKVKPWYKYLYMGETVRDRADSSWRREIEHDPLATVATVKVPTLVLFGAVDPWVPVATSVERLKKLAPQMTAMDVAVIAGADHRMQTSVTTMDQFDPSKSDAGGPEAPEYFARLSQWLTERGIAAR